MKIFVTGGTGFIGSHTVKLLVERNHELMLLIRNSRKNNPKLDLEKQVEFVYGDLAKIEGWKRHLMRFKPEIMLHMAWEGLPNYGTDMCMLNLIHGLKLFVTAGEAGCKSIVSTGSCWEYAKRRGALTEESLIGASKIVSAVKNSLRLIGEAVAKEHGMNFYWLRLFFVYGPGQRNTSLIPTIINSIRSGIKPQIRNPANRNDFVFVADVAEAIAFLIEKRPAGIVYNLGSGYSTRVSDIISLVYDAMGCEKHWTDDSSIKSDDDYENFWADITAIRNDVGWSPKYSLAEGIKASIEYYANQAKQVEK